MKPRLSSGIIILVLFNLVLGLLHGWYAYKNYDMLTYSPDLIGQGFLMIVNLVALCGFALAALGLEKQVKWGMIVHLVMLFTTPLLPSCCCVGLVYTGLGLVVSLQPNVWPRYFPPAPEAETPEKTKELDANIERTVDFENETDIPPPE